MVVADRFGVGTAPQVLRQVGEAVAAWPDFATRAKVSGPEVTRIREHHQQLSHWNVKSLRVPARRTDTGRNPGTMDPAANDHP